MGVYFFVHHMTSDVTEAIKVGTYVAQNTSPS